MGHAPRVAAVALAGLTLAACQGNTRTPSTSSGATTTPSPHLTGTGGPTPAGSGSPTGSGPLTTRAAQPAVEGRDYTTLYTFDPHGTAGVRSVGLSTIRADGSAIIVKDPTPAPGALIAQGQVGVQTGRSRTWFLPQTGSQPRQAFAAAGAGQSLAWLETTSTDLFFQDWKAFAARDGQRQPTLLGDSFDLTKTDEVPPPPGVKVLSMDGVHVWWTVTYPTKTYPTTDRRGWGARIMVRDVAGHEPLSTAVDRAKLPAATAGGVAYVRSNDVDPRMPANRYEIRLRRTGADTLVTSGPLANKDEQVSTMCMSDALLAWAVRSGGTTEAGQLHVLTLATKAERTVQLEDAAWSLDLGCGDSFVAWGNGSGNGDPGQYVLDVPSGKLWKLGEVRGISAVAAAGPMLGWTLPPKSVQEAAPWRISRWHGA